MIKKITNISDQGIICDFGEEVNKDINKKVINLFNYLKEKSNKNEIKGIYNIIPSYNKLVVHFDLEINNSHKIKEIISTIDLKKLNTTTAGNKKALISVKNFERSFTRMREYKKTSNAICSVVKIL